MLCSMPPAVLMVGLCGAALAHPHHHHMGEQKELLQPLVMACDGLALLTNCSASTTGICMTDHHDSVRSCSMMHPHGPHHIGGPHGHEHHPEHHDGYRGHHEHPAPQGIRGYLHSAKRAVEGALTKLGLMHRGPPQHHGHHGEHGRRGHPAWGTPSLGDCGSKVDGESCVFATTGRCMPTGHCPLFQGKNLCKAWGARPPPFVTRSCDGKTEGDACSFRGNVGKCHKPKYEDYLRCRPAQFKEVKDDEESSSSEPPEVSTAAQKLGRSIVV